MTRIFGTNLTRRAAVALLCYAAACATTLGEEGSESNFVACRTHAECEVLGPEYACVARRCEIALRGSEEDAGTAPRAVSTGSCDRAACPSPGFGSPCCVGPDGPCGLDTGFGCEEPRAGGGGAAGAGGGPAFAGGGGMVGFPIGPDSLANPCPGALLNPDAPSGFSECPEPDCSTARCVPSAVIPPELASSLPGCGDAAAACVPDFALISGGEFILETCDSIGGTEGRCLSRCFDYARPSYYPQAHCLTGEACVPCIDPVTQSPTGACDLGCDPGPAAPTCETLMTPPLEAAGDAGAGACTFWLPPPPAGEVLDPALVNIVLDDLQTRIFHVDDASACGDSPGWYYDNRLVPTQVIVCPALCPPSGAIHADIGCPTITLAGSP